MKKIEIEYLKNCYDLNSLKNEYKRLAKIWHPDINKDPQATSIMQQINNEYEYLLLNIATMNNSNVENDFIDIDLEMEYKEIINKIINFEFVIIELIGSWIWLSGATFPIKNELKEIGFLFAPGKKMWFWRPNELKKSFKSKPQNIIDIRNKYGSKIMNSYSKKELKGA